MVNRVHSVLYLPDNDRIYEDDDDHETNIDIKGKVIVKYKDKRTGEEISDRVNKTGKVGTEFDVSEDKKEISGYTLIEEPAEKTGVYKETVQEKIYYYAKNTKVHVTYVEKSTGKEIADDETILGYVGKSYETVKKEITNYRFVESTSNTSGTMKEGTIEVIYYYEANGYRYKVEYYYDGIMDSSKTETHTAKYGEIISTYTDKNKSGYRFEKTEYLPLTISDNESKNIIKVYYIKDDKDKKTLKYTVEYYKDGVKQEVDTQIVLVQDFGI